MKAYQVYGCNIDGFNLWSGKILDVNEIGVIQCIKNRIGVDELLCEQEEAINPTIKEIDPKCLTLSDLTVGEFVDLLKSLK